MKFFRDDTTLPVLTVIMNGVTTVDAALQMIREGIEEGAEAFCLQVELLTAEERTFDNYKKIFDAMEGRPAYVCCYRRNNTKPEQTEDEIAAELLMAEEAGAALLDIRTDMYCPSEHEITTDPEAVAKQKALIEEIHRRGSEALMSAHTFTYYTPDEVLKLARMQKERGADVCKIVCAADTDAELADAFLTSARLSKELEARNLFLVGGEKRFDHRMLGGFLGSSILLCVVDSNPGLQPKLSEAKKIREMLAEYRNR